MKMDRILLKMSGEALAGEKKTGFDEATCIGVAKQSPKNVKVLAILRLRINVSIWRMIYGFFII